MKEQGPTNVPTADRIQQEFALPYWSSLIEHIDVPTPETLELPLDTDVEGIPEFDVEQAAAMVKELGGEAFLRGPLKSASHPFEAGSHIQSPSHETITITVKELVSQHVMMQLPHGDTLYMREWLDLDWVEEGYQTFHPEVRFFVRDGEVVCNHLRTEIDEEHAFADRARAYFAESTPRHTNLTAEVHSYAERVAEGLSDEGWWSVDFVLTTNEDWYLTDMALDEVTHRGNEWQGLSFHPEDCEHHIEAILEFGGQEDYR